MVRHSTKLFVVVCLCFSAGVDIQAQASAGPSHASSVPLATIEHADITLEPDGLTIELALSAPFLPQGMRLTNPDRLVFDFPGFTLRAGNRHMPINRGPVRKFRAALFQSDPPTTRIVIDLKEPVNFDVKSVGNKVVIDIPFPKTSSGSAHALTPSIGRVEEGVVWEAGPSPRAAKQRRILIRTLCLWRSGNKLGAWCRRCSADLASLEHFGAKNYGGALLRYQDAIEGKQDGK